MKYLHAEFGEFLERMAAVKREQSRNTCPISKKKYFKKIEYIDYLFSNRKSLTQEEQESLADWAKDRHAGSLYLIFQYNDIGSTLFVVDKNTNQWKDITDYLSW